MIFISCFLLNVSISVLLEGKVAPGMRQPWVLQLVFQLVNQIISNTELLIKNEQVFFWYGNGFDWAFSEGIAQLHISRTTRQNQRVFSSCC